MSYCFKKYLKDIETNLQAGNATEHTHRLALQKLIESLAEGVVATNEPKRVACGAPDYIITKGTTLLGYIETKDVGKSLDAVEDSEQIKRYLSSLSNLIITDYLEFRWYVGGEHRLTARLARLGYPRWQKKPTKNIWSRRHFCLYVCRLPFANVPSTLR